MYNYDDVYNSSVTYFNGNELAAKIFVDKYALRNDKGDYLEKTPEDMHRRLAREFSLVEENKFGRPLTEDFIFECFDQFAKIIPQGSPLYAIGNSGQYISTSNCFVISTPEDSYGGIMKTDEELVQISKRRGGVGLDISKLRPANSPTKNSSRTSTGIIPFLGRYSNSIREVGQNSRRGALLVSCSIHHPESVNIWNENTDGKPFDVQVKTEDFSFKTTSEFYNPKNIDFCTSKYDPSKVTGANISLSLSNEFLQAVDEDKDYEQRWPIDSDNPQISKKVNARKVWQKIIRSAWQTAEPGLLFWDNIINESIPDCYPGFETTSTNPCIAQTTLVYTADGRGPVTIKELADKGDDVDVFCYDDKQKVVIRKMRNPRLTGYKPIFEVTLDDGSTIKTTGNHKFLLTNGEYKQVQDLQPNDSLKIITRFEASIKDIFPKANSRSQDYFWIRNGEQKREFSEHRVIAEFNFGNIPSNYVVHHKDYNAKNNSPDNLEVMTKAAHDKLHSEDMMGDKNPMRRAATEWDEEKWKTYRQNMSNATSGKNNGRYCGYTNDQIRQKALELTEKLGRVFSTKDWQKFAKKNNLPLTFSKFRKEELGKISDLATWAANQLNFPTGIDPRLASTYKKAIDNGYVAKIEDNQVFVKRKCEACDEDFFVSYLRRESSFCSQECATYHLNHQHDRTLAIQHRREFCEKNGDKNKKEQINAYNDLKFTLNRKPSQKEWEDYCRKKKIVFRLKSKNAFQKYSELEEAAANFNHRVVSVKECGYDSVYNGTVDDFHNFFVGGFEGKTEAGKPKSIWINNFQCGEIPLTPMDSCRLLLLNVFGFVKNPFTSNAYFDFYEFHKFAKISQRLMDDMIDIELNCINRIIDKIKDDPENDFIKEREIKLWENIREKCDLGRRTGTGLTAIGDTLAALNLPYDSDEGISIIEQIYKVHKFACYSSSIDMAEELGPFPIWDYEREKENPFLKRIESESIELRDEKGDIIVVNGKDLIEKMKKFGRRNIALLTTAPAGTVSNLAKLIKRYGTTSGIEPAFSIKPYIRRKKINAGDMNARVDFVDQNGDKWQNFEVYPSNILEWMEISGESDITKSPWHNSCANDLQWTKRVELQAKAQKHIDHSISSTVNIPEDISVEEVAKIYETAWKLGCKGITVYRQNCRSGVLIEKTEKKTSDKDSVKRPKSIPAKLYQAVAHGEKYFIAIGFINNEPYECFAGKLPGLKIGTNGREGRIEKLSRGIYSWVGEDDETVIENLTDYCSESEEALTRLLSTNLRHGCDLSFVVHQLEKTKGDMQSFAKVIARTLKKYIKDGVKVSGENCIECDSTNLVRQSGCIQCADCGWSKCS